METAALQEVTLPLVVFKGPVLALGGGQTCLAAMPPGSGPDRLVDVSTLLMEAAYALAEAW